jgi:hypothetical protein
MRRTFLLFVLSLGATLLFAVPASANLQAIVQDLRADGAGDPSANGATTGDSVEGEGATPTPETPLTASPAVPVLPLALLGGLMALGVVAWALARWWAFEPRWLLVTRHACTEAGYRASATWAEFSDWIRLGR